MKQKVEIELSLKEYLENLKANYYLKSFAFHLMLGLEMAFENVGEFDVCSELLDSHLGLVSSWSYWGFFVLVHLLRKFEVVVHVRFHVEIGLGFVGVRLVVDCGGLVKLRCL